MDRVNIIADTDSYKHGHPQFINNGLTFMYSYGEARVMSKYPETIMIGMSIILKKYLSEKITQEDLDEAIAVSTATHGFCPLDIKVWQRVIDGGGYLPIIIKSAPEGAKIPTNNVLFTIESTEEWFSKSIQLIEGLMMHIWYSCSVATRVYNIYKGVKPLYEKSGNIENLAFALNDFGLRGATSRESATIAGMMHLMFFDGSDNLLSSRMLRQFYEGAPYKAKSILATEHTIPLSFGRSGEFEYLSHVLDVMDNNDEQGVSIVIDTYDTYGFIRNHISRAKRRIIARKGRTVFRTDSGNPIDVPINAVILLGEIFGVTINEKGYKVIKHNVGVIQADGMDENTVVELYTKLLSLGYSADNIVTGSGGGLHQKDLTRDTQRFAIKASFGIINGEDYNFKKNPATDPTKTSKSGKMKLHPTTDGSYITILSSETPKVMFDSYIDLLKVVYDRGVITYSSFDQVQNEIKKYL